MYVRACMCMYVYICLYIYFLQYEGRLKSFEPNIETSNFSVKFNFIFPHSLLLSRYIFPSGAPTPLIHSRTAPNALTARWVPRLLTLDQKRIRMNISKALLERFKRNESDFLRRLITVDETWIHHFTPETKEQSKQWTAKGEPTPKKAKTVLSAGKVMATVFWDSHGIVLIDYLEKGKTITGTYYASLLNKLKAEIEKKRPHLKKKILRSRFTLRSLLF